MSRFSYRSALLAVAATLAFSGIAGPVSASGSKDNQAHWTHKQCVNQVSRWTKAHKHATAKQRQQENKLLKKHDCNESV